MAVFRVEKNSGYYASLVAHDMAQPDWGRPPNT